jgi:hypothetical protein
MRRKKKGGIIEAAAVSDRLRTRIQDASISNQTDDP